MLIAESVLWISLIYSLTGLVIAVPFALWGVSKIDDSAREASIGFRLLILPGCAALWPWALVRWLQVRKESARQ